MYRINHGVTGRTFALDATEVAAKVEKMLATGLTNILISRVESDVLVEQDDSDNGMETLTRLVFNVRVARPK